MKTIGYLKDLVKKYPRQFFFTLVFMLVLNIVEMCSVLSLAPVIDLLTKPDLKDASIITQHLAGFMKFLNIPTTLNNFMIILFFFILLTAAARIFVNIKVLRIKYLLISDLLCNTYKSFFNSRWYFFSSNSQGVLGNTLIKEMSSAGDTFGHLGTIFVQLSRIIFYFAIAFFVSWQISLFVVVSSLILVWFFSLLGHLSYNLGKINTSTANRIMEIVNETLGAAKVIIGYGGQDKSVKALRKSVETHQKATIKSQTLLFATPLAYKSIGFGILLFAMYIALNIFEIPLASLIIVFYALYTALPLLGTVATFKNEILRFIPALEQIDRLRRAAEEHIQPSGDIIFDRLNDKIVFSNVTFGYPGHEPVLCDINVEIPRGKMIAFTGKSGSGKTTLVDLLMRFCDPDKGTALVDGTDLKKFDTLSWRHKIGYVPQDSILFNMTIRENLLWSRSNATENDIIQACRLANAYDFINDMPKKLDTRVGDRGVRLSGGQRQRIALARAILRNPELLILDEATSSLDSHSEILIQQAIEKISRQITIVIIAHRLSTIINADYIYVLEGARIVEKGTYNELSRNKSTFYQLAKIQGAV